jgi:hypothetical protein
MRAKIPCSGYRDINELRIRDQSRDIRLKALLKTLPRPRSPPSSLDSQARSAFFAYYVTGGSKAWDFLVPFYHPLDTPRHLELSIEAVSLAYLSHQVHSEVALTTARERYGRALRLIKEALQSSEVVRNDTILLSSLVLDLFEKFTNTEPGARWTTHLIGALALVGIRGLSEFQDLPALRILVRLSTNLLISCVTSETYVPTDLVILRKHAERYLSIGEDPKWKLTSLMITYANLRANERYGYLKSEDKLQQALELDRKLQSLALDMPASWQYRTIIPSQNSEFPSNLRADVYPDRYITQTWNVLRLVRLLLNKTVSKLCGSDPSIATSSAMLEDMTDTNIKILSDEIVASAPQYINFPGAVHDRLLTEGSTKIISQIAENSHTPSHAMNCYTLIFPLYVAGRCLHSSDETRHRIINQLHYIGEQFDIPNAELVARILKNDQDVNPWSVHAMLGSYAFAA